MVGHCTSPWHWRHALPPAQLPLAGMHMPPLTVSVTHLPVLSQKVPSTHCPSLVHIVGQAVLLPLHRKLPAQAVRGVVPTLAGAQVPGVVVCAPQNWQLPAQLAAVRSQHTPSTQWPTPPAHMRQLLLLQLLAEPPALTSHANPCATWR
jgi:hypothetical protein